MITIAVNVGQDLGMERANRFLEKQTQSDPRKYVSVDQLFGSAGLLFQVRIILSKAWSSTNVTSSTGYNPEVNAELLNKYETRSYGFSPPFDNVKLQARISNDEFWGERKPSNAPTICDGI